MTDSSRSALGASGASRPVLLPVPRSGVVYRSLAEGAVLFSSADEVYFGLNEVGAKIWELLPPARETLQELVADLAAAFPEVDGEVIRADVVELLEQLAQFGLVAPRE